MLSKKDVEDLVKPLGLKIRLNMALKALHLNLENEVNNVTLVKSVSEASTIIIDGTPANNEELKLDDNSSVLEEIDFDISSANVSRSSLSEDNEDVQGPSPRKMLCKTNFFLDNLTNTELLDKSSKSQTVLRLYKKIGV